MDSGTNLSIAMEEGANKKTYEKLQKDFRLWILLSVLIGLS
jgi:hypothetical protein